MIGVATESEKRAIWRSEKVRRPISSSRLDFLSRDPSIRWEECRQYIVRRQISRNNSKNDKIDQALRSKVQRRLPQINDCPHHHQPTLHILHAPITPGIASRFDVDVGFRLQDFREDRFCFAGMKEPGCSSECWMFSLRDERS